MLTVSSTTPPALEDSTPQLTMSDSDSPSLSDSLSSSSSSSCCSCKNCGAAITVLSEADYPREAQLRIEELEQQVKEFSVRAVMAAERLAQAQKEVMELRRKSESGSTTSTSPILPSSTSASASASALQRNNTVTATLQNMSKVGSQKINQFFYRTSTTSTTRVSQPEMPPVERPPTPPESMSRASMDSQALDDLSNALCEERRHREIAEKQLTQVKSELEELSVSLFQQANEMVSSERRARARLEDRVVMLEKRDSEKRIRLEMLEKGFDRINRVRGVLNPQVGHI